MGGAGSGGSPQWLPPPKGPSRQAPWGFTTHFESQPPSLLQKRFVGGNALPQKPFLQFTMGLNGQRESPALVAPPRPIWACFCSSEETGRLWSQEASDGGESLCPGGEVTKRGSERCWGGTEVCWAGC